MITQKIIDSVNLLGDFCGLRDLEWPQIRAYQPDVFVLFGGSILAGGDLMVKAIQENIAKCYIVVGGEGHTTQTLRDKVHNLYPDIETDGQPEAAVFSQYIMKKADRMPDYLEIRSTNCGNNLTYLMNLLQDNHILCHRMVICQDATMQRRMDAGLRKLDCTFEFINYAAYHATWILEDGIPLCRPEINGMWEWERYVQLLMGEIPRLTDNEKGYGPKGKGFIAHTEIPQDVQDAFEYLKSFYAEREANPAYA